MSKCKLILGDCLEVMPTLAENSIDAIVTDPPYGLKFMGKDWDHGVPGVPFWGAALRVLKPGGHLLAFGGSRTYHRLACAVEDAGFEIRDQIMWIYGQGFPKSLNGPWGGTALKPAHEPICLARKPLVGTMRDNFFAYGVGGLNIETCRVDLGRFPANVLHDGSEQVRASFPDAPGQLAASVEDGAPQGNNIYGSMNRGGPHHIPRKETDKNASRFFYCAKASKRDRGDGNDHPTVKPTELMRYLCRLITPTGGVVLDPFMGSGSTGKAAQLESLSFIGVEKDSSYFSLAKTRLETA